MASIINTNQNSLSAQRQLGLNASSLGTAIQRLSSGLRINSAKDDAAGLAISERFTTQIKGTDQAARNANDAISLAQTAEGALASIGDNLQRIRELAVQSANGTKSASDRAALQAESAQLIAENDRIASQTQFNGTKLLDGSFVVQSIQLGADRQQSVQVNAFPSLRSDVLGQYNVMRGTNAVLSIGAASPLSVTLNGSGKSFNLGAVATDAKAIADALNNSSIDGLSAVASSGTWNGAQLAVGAVSGVGVATINGVNINLKLVAGSLELNRATAIAAINAQSAATGVLATDLTSIGLGIGLTTDGRNMQVSYASGTATGSQSSDFGFVAAGIALAGNLSVTYRAPTDIAVTSVNVSGAGFITFAGGSNKVLPSGTMLSLADISTVAGANSAIDSTDAALATVNTLRASLGALQNRFQSAIANLQTSAENMSASRSRIVDADFAQETANLSRSQILQQASTAMVAQANQATQGVLALLR